MAERKLTIKDIQPWYDRALAGDIQNPYVFEGMGSDRELKADFIRSRVLPIFVKDGYQRMVMENEWDANRPTPSPTPTGQAPKQGPTRAVPEYYGTPLPGTVGESDKMLENLLTPTPTPRY
jgi:hypothetical protein